MNDSHNSTDPERLAQRGRVSASPSAESTEPLHEDFEIDVSSPSGPPRPVRVVRGGLNALAGIAIVLASGAGTMHMLGGFVTACRGATVSSRLQWEQRRAEIQRALDERQQAEIESQSNEEAADEPGAQN